MGSLAAPHDFFPQVIDSMYRNLKTLPRVWQTQQRRKKTREFSKRTHSSIFFRNYSKVHAQVSWTMDCACETQKNHTLESDNDDEKWGWTRRRRRASSIPLAKRGDQVSQYFPIETLSENIYQFFFQHLKQQPNGKRSHEHEARKFERGGREWGPEERANHGLEREARRGPGHRDESLRSGFQKNSKHDVSFATLHHTRRN